VRWGTSLVLALLILMILAAGVAQFVLRLGP
jgi:hypothetical protein